MEARHCPELCSGYDNLFMGVMGVVPVPGVLFFVGMATGGWLKQTDKVQAARLLKEGGMLQSHHGERHQAALAGNLG